MTPIIRIAAFIWSEEKPAVWRGLLLSVAVLVAGALLLGLSGWFITAAGAAGLAGIGIAFDVFRPSAGVRFLALGRTAARYGERILTHDATLRVLARLRVRVLQRLAGQDATDLSRLRSPAMLNRITADVDALDGVAIRLVFPLLAGVATLITAAVVLAWLVSPLVAAAVVGPLLLGGGATMVWVGQRSIQPAAQAEMARQDLRRGVVEHLRNRILFAFSGALPSSRATVTDTAKEVSIAERELYRLERKAGAWVSGSGLIASAAALAVGGGLAPTGQISPALAALAFFASLALVEVIAPLQRAMAEIGRIRDAASRVAPMLSKPVVQASATGTAAPPARQGVPVLRLDKVRCAAPGTGQALTAPVTLSLDCGQTVGLVGRSGLGKSSLMAVVAGLVPAMTGRVDVFGRALDQWDEASFRQVVGMLPQRSQLMSGTVREALHLAAPDATDAEMWAVIESLDLAPALTPRGGLDTVLGEGGAGLSGGETRRLGLARVLLRRPALLLLDEPTEGLDAATAEKVLRGIRQLLPHAAILLTTHKAAEHHLCDAIYHLKDIN
jgi:ATP-binding cassette subfamily C protein CydC